MMPMSDEDQRRIGERLDAISRALARLSGRVEDLEARVARIEAPQAVPPPGPRAAEVAAAAQVWDGGEPGRPEAVRPGEGGNEAAGQGGMAERAESVFGLAWLNRAGVVTLVLGVAFLFKYAVDNAWIGPRGRVAAGLLAGVAALAGGGRLWTAGQRIFSMGITGLGICLQYVSWYAAYAFYGLAPVTVSFAGMAAATAAGAWLALRYDAAAIAVLALTGGLATPVVLSTGRDAPWVLFGYLLLLMAGAVEAARRRKWGGVEWLAFCGGAGIYASWFAERFEAAKRAPAEFFVFAGYALFQFSSSAVLRQCAQFTAGLAAAFLFRPDAGWFVAAALALAVPGLARGMTAAAAAGFWIPYWIHAAALDAGAFFGLRFAGIGAGFLLIHGVLLWRLRRAGNTNSVIDTAVMAMNGVAYYATAYALLRPEHGAWAGLFTLLAAAVFAASAWIVRAGPAAPVAGVLAAGFLTLAVPVQLGGWRVSAAWVLEAVALAVLARRLERRAVDWLSAGVLLLALERIAGFDARLAAERLFVNARFFAMLWGAAGCWVCAALLQPRGLAAAGYVAGHGLMLGGLEVEILDQVARTAAPENAHAASVLGFSMIAAGYGLVLVCLGVWRGRRVDRLMGLAVMALVAMKVYLHDVWELGRLFRSAALVGLGLVLVAASYLYSRHRERVARLLG